MCIFYLVCFYQQVDPLIEKFSGPLLVQLGYLTDLFFNVQSQYYDFIMSDSRIRSHDSRAMLTTVYPTAARGEWGGIHKVNTAIVVVPQMLGRV